MTVVSSNRGQFKEMATFFSAKNCAVRFASTLPREKGPTLEKAEVILVDLDTMPAGSFGDLRQWKESHPDKNLVLMGGERNAQVEDLLRNEVAKFYLDNLSKEIELAQLLKKFDLDHDHGEDQSTSAEEKAAVLGETLFPGKSLAPVRKRIRAAAEHGKVTVLLTGETGCGKQEAAMLIHGLSERAGRPFVDIDCASLPENILESELFGHERGAFTGAAESKIGLFESAQDGTIFLDEIGELPLHLQVKFLKVLEQRIFRRLGRVRPIPLEATVIAATNRNLEEEVRAGRFRADLLYRLNIMSIEIPPLRERTQEIPSLAQLFYRQARQEAGLDPHDLPEALLARLPQYDWPGNVRELKNAATRMAILEDPAAIISELLASRRQRYGAIRVQNQAAEKPPVPTLRQVERDTIFKALEHAKGNKTLAAKWLGISKPTMFRKLRDFNLEDLAPA